MRRWQVCDVSLADFAIERFGNQRPTNKSARFGIWTAKQNSDCIFKGCKTTWTILHGNQQACMISWRAAPQPAAFVCTYSVGQNTHHVFCKAKRFLRDALGGASLCWCLARWLLLERQMSTGTNVSKANQGQIKVTTPRIVLQERDR